MYSQNNLVELQAARNLNVKGMVLEVKNLSTHFKLPAGGLAKPVGGVSFSIKSGELVCLVGESGCGKSVTSFSIMQLLPRNAFHPTGEVLFKGRDILTMPVKERRSLRGGKIAMIFQEPGTSLNPVFRIGRQVSEVLKIHKGMKKNEAKQRVIQLFDEVGIPHPEERYNCYPHELSGGMKQRVMIAMALACEPELLIADEPTTALDVTVQAQILQLIKDLQKSHKMSVLMVTHNLRVVNQVADRVLVMYAGRIVEQAERRELFTNPKHPYTRQLLQAIPGEEVKGRPLVEIPGRVPPATNFPTHCRFEGRCSEKMALCGSQDPKKSVEVGNDHWVACLKYAEEGAL
jgi:oligopeptide/dipeptide ABC transporter ATP-binding protein